MRKIMLLAGLLFLINYAKAQDPLFLEGDKKINIGVGFSRYPVGSISVDYAIVDDIVDLGAIGVGPYVGLGFDSSYSYASVGARGTFHYPIIEDLDTYVGLGFGFRYAMSDFFSNDLDWITGFFIGANYPLNDNVLFFGEIGSGLSYLSAGITLFFE